MPDPYHGSMHVFASHNHIRFYECLLPTIILPSSTKFDLSVVLNGQLDAGVLLIVLVWFRGILRNRYLIQFQKLDLELN